MHSPTRRGPRVPETETGTGRASVNVVTGEGIRSATITSTVKGVREGSTLTVSISMTTMGAVVLTLKEGTVIEMATEGIAPAPVQSHTKQVILSDAMKPSEAILVPAPAATPDQPHRLPAANPGMIPSNSKQVRLSDAMKPSEAILVPAPAATPGQPHRLPAANPGMIPSNSKQVRLSDAMKPSEAILVPAPAATPGQPHRLPAANPGMIPSMAPNINLPALGQVTTTARRVYVGGIPPIANEQTVAQFFNQVMAAIKGNTSGLGNAVVNVHLNNEKKFAFVEMRSVEEASNAMALDGIMFEGARVKVRRPTDYNPSQAAALGPSQPNPNLNLAAVHLPRQVTRRRP
ncbi:hypothetical protein VPH35_053510 [Triticum aestivum]